MTKKNKKKWILIGAAAFVAIVALGWAWSAYARGVETVQTYAEAISGVPTALPLHISEVCTTQGENGESYTQTMESFASGSDYAILGSNIGRTIHWNGYVSENSTPFVKDEAQYKTRSALFSISRTYFTVADAKDVSYERQDDGILFTYRNSALIGQSVDGRADADGYTSAVSKVKVDNDWNVESVTVTETWDELQEDGSTCGYTRTTELTVYDDTDEEVSAAIESYVGNAKLS